MTGLHVSALRPDVPQARSCAWQIVESRFAPERLAQNESVFAVGNGYLGLRGAPEEGTPVHDPGVILNGFHETWPIVYPEDAYGLARTGQTIVDVTDGSIIRLFVDDEPFDIASARILRFERVLDMRIGVLMREVEWETARGRRVLVRSRRVASLADRHLAAIDYEVVMLDGDAAVTICSELVTHAPALAADDPRRGKGFAEKVLVPRAARTHGDGALLLLATRNSGLELGCGMTHTIDSPAQVTVDAHAEGDGARVVVQADLAAGESLRLSKFVAYHWAPSARDADLLGRVERTLGRAVTEGYGGIEAAHSAEVEQLLAAQRHRARGRSRAPAGRALQPVLADAGDRAHRGARRAGEGRERARLRGPLLLGHRDLRRAVPVPYDAPLGQAGARVPLRDARRGAHARAGDRPHRGGLPVEDDQRVRGVGVVRSRHRAVPHQRRHRLRDAPVQPGHRRSRLHARPGRRGARRDGTALDASSAFTPSAAAGASASTR